MKQDFQFSMNRLSVNKYNMLDIHKNLMKKHNIK